MKFSNTIKKNKKNTVLTHVKTLEVFYLMIYLGPKEKATHPTSATTFINSKTEAYGAINAMWSSYRKEDPPTSLLNKVCLVTIYNGELFIFTGAHNVNLWGGWSGKYPVVMYTYDIIANDVLYLGYYNGKWIDLDANSPVPFGFRYVDE